MADNYKAWDIDERDFPKTGTTEERIRFLLSYGILAPSVHNTQPWLFDVVGNSVKLQPDPKLSLPAADPDGRGTQISLGACVANIEAAANHFNMLAAVSWSDEGVIINFREQTGHKTDRALLSAITRRYSDKLPYLSKPLPEDILKRLQAVPAAPGCNLTVLKQEQDKTKVADIHLKALGGYGNSPAFFRELAEWMRPSKTKSSNGMPGFVVGLPNAASIIFKRLFKKGKPPLKLMAKKDRAAIISSSAVAVISTAENDTASWFEAGRYYERLSLELAVLGLVNAPLAAMIESAPHRRQLETAFKISGNAQIFFRLGYSKHKPYHTPRHLNPRMKTMHTQRQLLKIIDCPLEYKATEIDGYNISYIVAGKGQPLLMLHGANIGWAQWYQNLAKLAEHRTVYALDLPGAGSSTKVDFHKTDFDTFIRIVDKFVQQEIPGKIDIVGSSFGGWIALKLAILNKPYINKVVLSNPLGFTTHMPLQFRPVSLKPFAKFMTKTALRPDRKNKNLEKFMRDVFHDKQLPLAPEFIDYFYELSKTSHNLMFISSLAHFKGMRAELFLGGQLKKVQVPVLVIWGMQDPLMPFKTVEASIAEIPNVKLERLDDIGHMPPVEAPERFNELTTNFLRSG